MHYLILYHAMVFGCSPASACAQCCSQSLISCCPYKSSTQSSRGMQSWHYEEAFTNCKYSCSRMIKRYSQSLTSRRRARIRSTRIVQDNVLLQYWCYQSAQTRQVRVRGPNSPQNTPGSHSHPVYSPLIPRHSSTVTILAASSCCGAFDRATQLKLC